MIGNSIKFRLIRRSDVLVRILAATVCTAVLVACGSALEERINDGKQFLAEEKLIKAAEEFEKAAAVQPENPEAHYLLGVVLNRMRSNCSGNQSLWYESGLRALSRAIELNPSHGGSYFERGLLREEFELALKDLGRAIELNEKPAFAHYERARIHLVYPQLSPWSATALDEINRAIEIDPDVADFYELRGGIQNWRKNTAVILGLTEDIPDGLDDFILARDNDPTNGERYVSLGNMLTHSYSKKTFNVAVLQFDEGIALLERKINNEQNSPESGQCKTKAQKDVKSAISQLPDAYDSRAEVWEKLGEHARAHEDRRYACEIRLSIEQCRE